MKCLKHHVAGVKTPVAPPRRSLWQREWLGN